MSIFRVMFSKNKTYAVEVEIDGNDFQEAREIAKMCKYIHCIREC